MKRPIARRLGAAIAIVASTVLFTASPAPATFSGQNGRIAFSLDKGNGAQIYTIRPDGTGRLQLTHVNGSALRPDWSPDGRHIAFEMDHPSGSVHCSVEIIDADGSNVRDLTGIPGGCDSAPAFTPNGRRIVFAHDCDSGCFGAIWSMNLRGEDRRFVWRDRGQYPGEPQVSPGGRRVLFLGDRDPADKINGVEVSEKALYSVRMDGTHLETVVPYDLDVCGCGGDWSPSGKRIAFSDNAGQDEFPQTKPTNVATIRPDGTGLRFVTHFESIQVYVSSGSYSPDGRWILFKTQRGDRYALWKIHPDGTHQTLIARFKFNPGTRDWGPRPTKRDTRPE
ncbi:MAG TPA: hypothetical protein VEQ37_04445 [Actinomycetota bacterium]|nr:hypothetical protein [Actinomycetota bacterium]